MILNDLNAFVQSLNNEFNTFPNLVTEDSIRRLYIENYSQKINSEIEIPYYNNNYDGNNRLKLRDGAISLFAPTRKRNGIYKRIDLYDKSCDCAVEFKYHRNMGVGTPAHTDNFGYVFNDMNRLSLLDNKNKLLIYIFDEIMYDYFKGKNRCSELYGKQGVKFSSSDIYNRTKGKEFNKIAFSGFNMENSTDFNYGVEILYSHDFILKDSKFYLRIYEINR